MDLAKIEARQTQFESRIKRLEEENRRLGERERSSRQVAEEALSLASAATKGLADLQESHGTMVAQVTAEWRNIDKAWRQLGEDQQREFDVQGRYRELDDRRYQLVSDELARLSKSMSDLRDDWEDEPTGVRQLRSLAVHDSIYPADSPERVTLHDIALPITSRPKSASHPMIESDAPPAKAAKSYYTAKLLGGVAAIILAFAGMITAFGDCVTKVKGAGTVQGPGKSSSVP